MKKLVCLLLVLAFVFSGAALADNESSEQTPAVTSEEYEYLEESPVLYSIDTADGLSFNIYDSFAGVSGCNDTMVFSVTIPDTVEGKPVKKIENGAFEHFVMLTSVSFPKGLVSIGDMAFTESNLSDIELPESLRIIGKSAFEGCSFRHIVLPSGLETIADSAFSYCLILKSVEIPLSVQSIGDDAFSNSGPLQIRYLGTKEQWDALVGDNSRCGLGFAVLTFAGDEIATDHPEKKSV